MRDTPRWNFRASMALLAVLMLHVAVIAALLVFAARPTPSVSAVHTVELLFLRPNRIPKSDGSARKDSTIVATAPITPPTVDSPTLPPIAYSSDGASPGQRGQGLGVDWLAEAHRAIQAFDIRSRQPKDGMSVAGSPAEDHWWPRTRHRAGEQFKTAGGDWIVWINSNCYQVAKSASNAFALSSTVRQTICIPDSGPRQ